MLSAQTAMAGRPISRARLEEMMRYSVALLAAVCLFNVVGVSGIAAQQAQPVSTTPAAIDEMLTAFRSDMQANRADVMAKNLSMTAAEAAKFWPVFDAYQKE